MEGAGLVYAPPVVRDYGDLVSLTKANAVMFHVGLGGVGDAGSSTPTTPGGGGGGTTPTGISPATPGGATLPATEGGGGSTPGGLAGTPLGASAGGGSGGGGAGGSGGGHGGGGALPFTGFAVAVIGALGSGMAATGVALRHRLRRARSPR